MQHNSAAAPRVLWDKWRSDCWSISAEAKPTHELTRGQYEAHTRLGQFSSYSPLCYGGLPPPYVFELEPAPSLISSQDAAVVAERIRFGVSGDGGK